MDRIGFDIEGDGLIKAVPSRGIREVTKVFCIWVTNLDTEEDEYYGPPVPKDAKHPITGEDLWTPLLGTPTGTVEDGINRISKADLAIAHNGIGYDYLALEKLYPNFKRPTKAWDTLILAKLVWHVDTLFGPDLKRARDGKMPMKFVKRHSLEAWGYRLGCFKEGYTGGFDEWNPWMSAYMKQDVVVMVKLWNLITKRLGWDDPDKADLVWPERVVEVEHRVAAICTQQELDGVRFNVEAAQLLTAQLENDKADIEQQLKDTFGSWWQAGKVFTPAADRKVKLTQFPDVTVPRFSETTGKELKPYVGPPLSQYIKDAPYTPIEWMVFNPSSRQHLGMRLQDVFKWKPKKFGARGEPTVDESVLEEIPEAVMPKEIRTLILDYFVVNKTLGMLANGAKSWLNALQGDRIHGRVDTLGAITNRGTHSNPNLGQCPSVRMEKVVDPDTGRKYERPLRGRAGRYGYECRELFIADEGWEQTGVDASALELIDLGHYLMPFDNGVFSERVCDPARDPHTEHADLTGLTRGDTKTATYLYVYGGSAYKLSLDLTIEPHEIPENLAYRGLPMLLTSLRKRFDDEFVENLDDAQKAKIAKARQIILKFENGITGIKELKDSVTQAAKRGWLRGMDGRKIIVRKAHAALNALLQSAGAQSCKVWMVLTHQYLNDAGLYHGRDFKQLLWVHDELQFTHRPGLSDIIKECAERAMRDAGIELNLRGTYRTEGKTGANWAECH